MSKGRRSLKKERAKELAVLNKIREALSDPAEVEEIRKEVDASLDPVTKMRYMGLHWEAMEAMSLGSPRMVKDRDAATRLLPFLHAAMVRCTTNICPHIGPLTDKSPFCIALLAARVLTCKKCLPDFLLSLAPVVAGHADECDLCLKCGVHSFSRHEMAVGGMLFLGDFCPECHVRIKEVLGEA